MTKPCLAREMRDLATSFDEDAHELECVKRKILKASRKGHTSVVFSHDIRPTTRQYLESEGFWVWVWVEHSPYDPYCCVNWGFVDSDFDETERNKHD